MEYQQIKQAKFLSRPNRFMACIEINGKIENCHVKNTGRCRELLTPGASIFVQESAHNNRKTKYDLISVRKGPRLINIDSQAPNKVFYEWITGHKWIMGHNFWGDIVSVKPECPYGDSRLDFYMETASRKIWVEVKGVTLEENGIALFPDAPTERGIKHLARLCQCLQAGDEAYMVFIIQMNNLLHFAPNWKTHRAFGDALVEAEKQGLKILALDCDVTKNSIQARNLVEVKLHENEPRKPQCRVD